MGLWADLDCADPRPNAAERALVALFATRTGARVAAVALPRVDSAMRWLTRGRTTLTQLLAGLPTITLVTTGARSGMPRSTHLIPIPHGGDLAIIGSNFGGAPTPGWVHNLRADPRVRLVHGRRDLPAVARPLAGEESEQVWATARGLYAGYGQYRERAAHREITVWLLTSPAS